MYFSDLAERYLKVNNTELIILVRKRYNIDRNKFLISHYSQCRISLKAIFEDFGAGQNLKSK